MSIVAGEDDRSLGRQSGPWPALPPYRRRDGCPAHRAPARCNFLAADRPNIAGRARRRTKPKSTSAPAPLGTASAPAKSRICLCLRPPRRRMFQILQHGFLFRQARVDVLGINSKLAAVAPAHFARQRRQRIDHGAAETSFSLARYPPRPPPASRDRFPNRCSPQPTAPDSRWPAPGSAGQGRCAVRPPERECWRSAHRRPSRSIPIVPVACSWSEPATPCLPGLCSSQ